MKKIVPILILTCIYMLLQACSKDAKCKEFTLEERSWVPFTNDEILVYKNQFKDSTITVIVKKGKINELKGNKNEGMNYCSYDEGWWLESIDTVNNFLFFSIHMYNLVNKSKNNYDFYLKMYDYNYKPIQARSKSLNGILYQNVLTVIGNSHDKYDSVYYAKNIGCIAFHKSTTNQWYYKQ